MKAGDIVKLTADAIHEGWKQGVRDSIAKVKARLDHYERYTTPGEPMGRVTATLATLRELLVFLEAMLERGTANQEVIVQRTTRNT